MNHATQLALLDRIFAMLDAGTTTLAPAPATNTPAAYTDAARLAAERERLIWGEPLVVGLSADVPAAGDFLVHDDAGVPILVVRRPDGTLSAFLALCRHRGAQVVSGRGHSTRFACPYHGWTYDAAGALVAQPCPEGFDGLHRDDLGLRPLPVTERHGLIVARATVGPAIDIDAHLAGAEQELAPLDLARYVPFAREVVRPRMNWKLVLDGFMEAYHVPMLHAGTLSPGIMGSPAVWDAFGRSGRLIAARASVAKEGAKPPAERSLLPHTVILWTIFPHTVLIHQIDHIEMVQAFPGDDPDHAVVTFALYTPGPVTTDRARQHFQANWDLLLRTIMTEDFRVGETMQRGFHAPGAPAIVYGRNEPGVAHFHAGVAAALA